MPRQKDPLWEHAEVLGPDKNKCKFCNIEISGGISRLKYHWAKMSRNDVRVCAGVTDLVMEQALHAVNAMQDKPRVNKRQRDDAPFPPNLTATNSSSSVTSQLSALEAMGHSNSAQPKILELVKKKEKEIADILGTKFCVSQSLAFNIFRSEELRLWCLAIGQYGPGYVPPSSETARTKLLGSLKDEATLYVKTVQASWKETGCTLMSDSWSDAKKRSHVNLVASSPSGIVFLKSVCLKGAERQTGEYLANFIMSGIEDVGAENVVQVVTDNAKNCISAGRLIEAHYPHVIKTTCAAHGLDLALEDIDADVDVSPILHNAKKIVGFLYGNPSLLSIMRTFTNGRELKRPGITRFATNFLCLQSVLNLQEPLRFLVSSNEWKHHRKAKDKDTKEVVDIIQSDEFWEKGKVVLEVVEPIVKVLRMVDGDQSTLGYIYEALERVKKSIKIILKDDPKYLDFWKIIDFRKNTRIHHHIHAVAAYFNVKLYFDGVVQMNPDIVAGLNVVRQRMLKQNQKSPFTDELAIYHSKHSKLFTPIAVDALSTTHPRLWWAIYGGATPIIRQIAMRLLSQPCSSSACERNWSAFEAAHTKKRSRLEPTRLSDLVYVRMNLHMQKTAAKKMEDNLRPLDLNEIVAFPDDLAHGDDEQSLSDNDDDAGDSDEEPRDDNLIDSDETQAPSADGNEEDARYDSFISSLT
ncbi:hypothetical protein ACHQM5_025007 [Ranunculus cassubicifolius]